MVSQSPPPWACTAGTWPGNEIDYLGCKDPQHRENVSDEVAGQQEQVFVTLGAFGAGNENVTDRKLNNEGCDHYAE